MRFEFRSRKSLIFYVQSCSKKFERIFLLQPIKVLKGTIVNLKHHYAIDGHLKIRLQYLTVPYSSLQIRQISKMLFSVHDRIIS